MKLDTKFLANNLINHFNQKFILPNGYAFSKPIHITIMLTLRCNCKCIMCTAYIKKEPDMDFDVVVKTLDSLKKWIGCSFFIDFAGGEVLLYKDIYKLIEFCAKNKIFTKITTNGELLDKINCDKLIAAGLSYLSVSIDSLDPEIHNSVRGVPGVLEKALRGIQYLTANNIKVGISTVISRKNIRELEGLTKTLFDYYNISAIIFNPILFKGVAPVEDSVKNDLCIKNLDELKYSISNLINLKKQNYNILNNTKELQNLHFYFKGLFLNKSIMNNQCKVGTTNLLINCRGDINLCRATPSLGNVISDNFDIARLWNSEKTKNLRLETLKCKKGCASGCYRTFSLYQKAKWFLTLRKS